MINTLDLGYRIGKPKLIARAPSHFRTNVTKGIAATAALAALVVLGGAIGAGINDLLNYAQARGFSKKFETVYSASTNEAIYSSTYEDALRIEDQTGRAIKGGNDSKLLKQVNSEAHMLAESIQETRPTNDFYLKMVDDNRAQGL